MCSNNENDLDAFTMYIRRIYYDYHNYSLQCLILTLHQQMFQVIVTYLSTEIIIIIMAK